jgi:hypothetical protein
MSEKPTAPEEPQGVEFKRFKRLARALFQVDKRDVPKHEPVKRVTSKGERTPS